MCVCMYEVTHVYGTSTKSDTNTHTQLVRRDEELCKLRAELLSMGQQRQLLEQQVEVARARVQTLEASQEAKEEEIAQLQAQVDGLMSDLEQCSALLAAAKEKEEEYEMGFSQQYRELVEMEAQKMSEERKARGVKGN